MIVKKYKAAIVQIRNEIKTLAEEKPKMRAAVRAIKFDAQGKRRPETGSERCLLKNSYDSAELIRANLLAYSLLRGRPYVKQEPKVRDCVPQQTLDLVHHVLQLTFNTDKALAAEWPIERVVSLILEGKEPSMLPVVSPIVAAPEPSAPPKKGLLRHLLSLWSVS
jgi:hypothetical protein